MRTNSELVGKWGNFIHRALTFLQRALDGQVVALPSQLTDASQEVLSSCTDQVNKIKTSYETYTLRGATKGIVVLAQIANTYFDHMKPWKLAKEPDQGDLLKEVMAVCLRIIELMTLVLSPIAPVAAQKSWEQLGLTDALSEQNWDAIVTKSHLTNTLGNTLPVPNPIFTKVEDDQVELFRQKLFGK